MAERSVDATKAAEIREKERQIEEAEEAMEKAPAGDKKQALLRKIERLTKDLDALREERVIAFRVSMASVAEAAGVRTVLRDGSARVCRLRAKQPDGSGRPRPPPPPPRRSRRARRRRPPRSPRRLRRPPTRPWSTPPTPRSC
jgi:hypothetical protein